jgi:hypothetical protein
MENLMSVGRHMSLAEKTKIALDESRMLMLGAQNSARISVACAIPGRVFAIPPEKATEIVVLYSSSHC